MKNILLFVGLFFFTASSLFSQCNEERIWDEVWYSCEKSPAPGATDDLNHWILYDLGQVYALAETQVWNINTAAELDRGFRQVRIEYSQDSVQWFTLGEYEFEQGSGNRHYEGFEGPHFEGVQARYVLLVAMSTWGDESCAGLTEVKFSTVENNISTPLLSQVLKESVIVYPNPASERVNLSYSSERRDDWELVLYNQLGQIVASSTHSLTVGNNRLVFPLDYIPGGTYWLQAVDKEGLLLFGKRIVVNP